METKEFKEKKEAYLSTQPEKERKGIKKYFEALPAIWQVDVLHGKAKIVDKRKVNVEESDSVSTYNEAWRKTHMISQKCPYTLLFRKEKTR